jgi:hypothetical protein
MSKHAKLFMLSFVFLIISAMLGFSTVSSAPSHAPTGPSKLFLPIVIKQEPPPSVNVIVNGNFEQGASVGWQEFSLNGWPLILDDSYLPIIPRSGSWAVWLGGDIDEISYVAQQVTVPASYSTLRFWYWIASEDACGYDFGGVVVNNSTVVDQFDLCAATSTGAWVQRSVSLGAYAGQNIQIQIRVETDNSYNSNLFVDDVSLGLSSSSPALTDGVASDVAASFQSKPAQLLSSAENEPSPTAAEEALFLHQPRE